MAEFASQRETELIDAIIKKLEENRAVLRSAHGRVTWRRKGDKVEITLEPTL